MITTRPFNFMAIVNGLALTILLIGMSPPAIAQDNRLNAKVIQDRDYPARSNSEAGRRILANAPPTVPGYRQFMGFYAVNLARLGYGRLRWIIVSLRKHPIRRR